MDQRHVVRMLAMVRIAIGVVAFVAPRRAGALAFGAQTPSPAFEQVTRAFGARDVVLGVGTLRALDRDVDAEGWARMSAACDASDVAASLLWVRRGSTWRAVVAGTTAAAAATLGWRASSRLG